MFRETLCVSSLTALSPGRGKGGACSSTTAGLGLLGVMQPTDEQVAARLSAPVVTTQLDTRNIAFERSEKILLCTEQKYTGCEKSKLINSFSSATGLAPLICCSFFFLLCFVFSPVEKNHSFVVRVEFLSAFLCCCLLHCNPQLSGTSSGTFSGGCQNAFHKV